ncbi:hypothetical protein MTBPR1_230007 [Candidatus Terasakiella magnetica]|uniref:Transposase n=1 Tax=Candidatus Terasakiella magnetica TaxID=1867952 RepID=A0A1C3RH66_9PROT|nr:hypothetical protein MTBPR1_230007 [Candidatus Terasakiella magnetica]
MGKAFVVVSGLKWIIRHFGTLYMFLSKYAAFEKLVAQIHKHFSYIK